MNAEVTEIELEFEHLALQHRTVFRWTRAAEPMTAERVDIELERDDAIAREWFEPPSHLWAEFIEALEAVFPQKVAASPDATVEAPPEFFPSLGVTPDARTVPQRVVNSVQFLRCRVHFVGPAGHRQTELSGKTALELMTFVFDFATAFGVALPR